MSKIEPDAKTIFFPKVKIEFFKFHLSSVFHYENREWLLWESKSPMCAPENYLVEESDIQPTLLTASGMKAGLSP